MSPIVFRVGSYGVIGYPFFLFCGFAVGIVLATRQARRADIDDGRFWNLMCLIVISAAVGSRAAFVLEEVGYFQTHPLEALRFWTGGLSFYGGFAAALATSLAYMRYVRLPILRISDICAPYLTLGHAFGKVGCLMAGCCYGALTSCITGMRTLSMARDVAPHHPAQIYEFAGLLVLFLILAARRDSPKPRPEGLLLGIYMVGYGVLRVIVEAFRDPKMIGPLYLGLGVHQWASLVVLVCGIGLLVKVTRRS